MKSEDKIFNQSTWEWILYFEKQGIKLPPTLEQLEKMIEKEKIILQQQ